MPTPRVYLDHVASAPLCPAAREALERGLGRGPGNPSSPHLEGRAAKDALELARTRAAAALGVRPRELVFASGATEALQIALYGVAAARAGISRRLVCGAVEHPAVGEPLAALASQGFERVVVPVGKAGTLDPDALVEAARPGAALVALMLANHEMGAVFPVREVAERLAPLGVPLVCDAALGPGRLPSRPEDLGAAAIAWSPHKFGGPPGMGLLYVRRGTRLVPWLRGGVQEEGLRPGTENVTGALATAAALAPAIAETEERAARYRRLIARWEARIGAVTGVHAVGPGGAGLPGVLTIEVDGVEGEAAMINMDLEGFAVSTGSACALGGTDPSPGLMAIGLSRRRAAQTVRVSVGEGTTDADVDRAAEAFARIVARLRALAAGMSSTAKPPA